MPVVPVPDETLAAAWCPPPRCPCPDEAAAAAAARAMRRWCDHRSSCSRACMCSAVCRQSSLVPMRGTTRGDRCVWSTPPLDEEDDEDDEEEEQGGLRPLLAPLPPPPPPLLLLLLAVLVLASGWWCGDDCGWCEGEEDGEEEAGCRLALELLGERPAMMRLCSFSRCASTIWRHST